MHLGQFSEPKREPRWSPNGTQEGPKSKTKTKKKKEALEDHLGAILAHLGGRLGVILRCFVLENVLFRENQRFWTRRGVRRRLGAKLGQEEANSGTQRAPKWHPKEGQDGAKKEKKK